MDSNYNNTIQSKTIDQIHRIIISKALSQKDNVTTIAKELGFSRQSIHKEIKRGTIIKKILIGLKPHTMIIMQPNINVDKLYQIEVDYQK